MVMQAYDFLELARRHGCRLQMGGSDQWGNIVNGVELGRRIDGSELFGADHAADHHRLRRQDGQDRGRRGLAQRGPRCTPFDYWQYWRNTDDADVGRFLRLFTELPLDEIERLERPARAPSCNEAKKVLAVRGDPALPRRRRGRAGGRRGARGVRGRRRRRCAGLPAVELRRARGCAAGCRVIELLFAGRPRRLERRGAPAGPRRRRAAQRRADRRRGHDGRRGPPPGEASSRSPPAASATPASAQSSCRRGRRRAHAPAHSLRSAAPGQGLPTRRLSGTSPFSVSITYICTLGRIRSIASR